MSSLATTLLSLSHVGSAGAIDYHLAADGDDANDGLSPERPWHSLARIPTRELQPGDRVLLRGGDRFHGNLRLTVSGTAERPITIASWGCGRALIAPPPGVHGLAICDAGHIVVRGLHVAGSGAANAEAGSGICVEAVTVRSAGLAISDVTCTDFPFHGIQLSCEIPGSGCDDILVERVMCSGNGEGGLGSWAEHRPGIYAFHRVTVRDSLFFGNRGRPAKLNNHSGNGIILGGCQDAVIERCAAWGNGDLCNSSVGGPIGIWLCESDRSVIRACVSFRNRTGAGVPDGGGFDLDGGCTRCVIEDCLSWRNDGAGYLVYQYERARELRGCVIRNCFSIGDGRTRNNGGIYVGAVPVGDVHEVLVERCTVVMDPSPSEPACLRFTGPVDAFRIENSLFVSLGGVDFWNDAGQTGSVFSGNRWLALGSAAAFRGGVAPAGDTLGGELPGLIPPLSEHIDEAWLARLVVDGVGAVPLLRYGPAPAEVP